MLKVRIIPTLLYKDFGLVKGIRFDSWRGVGSALQAVEVYQIREVDELLLFDISATANGSRSDFPMFDELADACFMPLTAGGGIRTLADFAQALHVGADKVALNTAAVETPQLIDQAALQFGCQCVVISIDARRMSNRQFEVFTRCGRQPTGKDPVSLAKEVESRGAGEILLTSIDQDGTMEGYDIELVDKVSEAVSIPVIASGGAGKYSDMAEVLGATRASAVAAASMFHFTQQTPLEAKKYLAKEGFAVRL